MIDCYYSSKSKIACWIERKLPKSINWRYVLVVCGVIIGLKFLVAIVIVLLSMTSPIDVNPNLKYIYNSSEFKNISLVDAKTNSDKNDYTYSSKHSKWLLIYQNTIKLLQEMNSNSIQNVQHENTVDFALNKTISRFTNSFHNSRDTKIDTKYKPRDLLIDYSDGTDNNYSSILKQNCDYFCSSSNLLPIDNLAPLVKRFRLTQYFDLKKPNFREPTIIDNMLYVHTHKSGGTTVIRLFRKLHQKNYVSKYYTLNDVPEYLFDLNNVDAKKLVFTYVRDPIDRFLSGYFEIRKRGFYNQCSQPYEENEKEKENKKNKKNNKNKNNNKNNNKNDNKNDKNNSENDVNIDCLRQLISEMLIKKKHNQFGWKLNHHIWPQVMFVTDRYGHFLPIDYIGRTETIDISLPYLINKYESTIDENIVYHLLTEGRYRTRFSGDSKHINLRHYGRNRDTISRHYLSKQDITNICDLYWIDYVVFDFEIPNQECKQIIIANYNNFTINHV